MPVRQCGSVCVAADDAAPSPSPSSSSSPRVLKAAWLSVGVLAGLCCVVGHLALTATQLQQQPHIATLTPRTAVTLAHDVTFNAVDVSPAARRLTSTEAGTRQHTNQLQPELA